MKRSANRLAQHKKEKDFDLQYSEKLGKEFELSKDMRFKHSYDTDYEDVDEPNISDNSADDFEVDQGDENLEQVMQYKSSIVAPHPLPKIDPTLPDISIAPEFINGFVCLQSTQNVFYINPNKILFAAGLYGVSMELQTRKQNFFGCIQQITKSTDVYQRVHKSPITCITFDPQTGLAATGTVGSNPQICIWTVDKMKPMAKFYQGKGTKIISSIKFIGNRNVLTVDRQSQSSNNLTVWTLDGRKTIIKCPGIVYTVSTQGSLFAVASSKGAFTGKYTDKDDMSITCIQQGSFSSTAFYNEDPIFGKPTGQILFKGETYAVHKGCIYAMTCKDQVIYSTGSDDKLLRILKSQKMKEIKSIQLEQYARSIDVLQDKILLGLRNGKIIEIKDKQIETIMDCHFIGETFGLCYDKTSKIVTTSGEDNKVIRFSLQSMKVEITLPISNTDISNKKYKKNWRNNFQCSKQSRAVAANDHLQIFVSSLGKIYASRRGNLANVWQAYDIKDRSQTIQFSPNQKILAVGCQDCCIYIFEVSPQKPDKQVLEFKNRLFGHCSFITSIDFSEDNLLLRSIGNEGELRYWSLSDYQEIVMNSNKTSKSHKKQVKDAQWVSISKFCWATDQLWRQFQDVNFVNTLKISNDKHYIALGQDDNCVRIYRSPCSNGRCRKFRSHAGNVLNLCWIESDSRIASVGADRCLVIWRVSEI